MQTATVSRAPTPAQARTIKVALTLFAQHGVGATSFQMIAEALGVTKAAVYHQFRSKERIVVAAVETEVLRLEAILVEVEGLPAAHRRNALVTCVVDLSVEGRHRIGALSYDPQVLACFRSNALVLDVMGRVCGLIAGDGPDGLIEAAVVTAALSGAAVSLLTAEIPDDVLRAQLMRLAHSFLSPIQNSDPSGLPLRG